MLPNPQVTIFYFNRSTGVENNFDKDFRMEDASIRSVCISVQYSISFVLFDSFFSFFYAFIISNRPLLDLR